MKNPRTSGVFCARNTTHRVLHPLGMCLDPLKKPRDEVIFFHVYVLAQFNQHSYGGKYRVAISNKQIVP
jgi:hypothetical protein